MSIPSFAAWFFGRLDDKVVESLDRGVELQPKSIAAIKQMRNNHLSGLKIVLCENEIGKLMIETELG